LFLTCGYTRRDYQPHPLLRARRTALLPASLSASRRLRAALPERASLFARRTSASAFTVLDAVQANSPVPVGFGLLLNSPMVISLSVVASPDYPEIAVKMCRS
jgi:hypothetical protein